VEHLPISSKKIGIFMENKFNLERFKIEQKLTLETAEQELKNGLKISHWMWWIFPQLKELGHSYTSKVFGIGSKEEAQAYMNDELLRKNYIKCCQALLYFHKQNSTKTIDEIMEFPDNLKLKSSLTLFLNSTDDIETKSIINEVLDIFYDGKQDQKTLKLLNL